jgi:excisionase family DNA binding protein
MQSLEIQNQSPNPARKPFLSMEEVAELLGCSKRVVYNWTRRTDPATRPPKIVVGKTIRFPADQFFEWLYRQQGK